jgi:hypothetical protein
MSGGVIYMQALGAEVAKCVPLKLTQCFAKVGLDSWKPLLRVKTTIIVDSFQLSHVQIGERFQYIRL